MKTGIVICTRLESNRLPGKAVMNLNGRPLIWHLVKRLQPLNMTIVIATPPNQKLQYQEALKDLGPVSYYSGHADDPLARMAGAANLYSLRNVIRVSHDKIFVEPEEIIYAFNEYDRSRSDYLYSADFIPGCGFEIIDSSVLSKAAQKYKNVEYIGYAVKTQAKTVVQYTPRIRAIDCPGLRLLIDYPQDRTALEVILSALGNDAKLPEVINFVLANNWVMRINGKPKLTFYTCAYNAARFIERCMRSVERQDVFKHSEYLLIDDFSKDNTPLQMAKFSTLFPNVRFMRNARNLGLASSSNVALKNARGDYIMRLDADDFFLEHSAAGTLLSEIVNTKKDVVIPSNYFGSVDEVQPGKIGMHVGGSIFKTAAVNHLKFSEGLRGYEGLDFFVRAREMLDIGFLDKPLFFYFQRPDSLSKTNLAEREQLKQRILSQ